MRLKRGVLSAGVVVVALAVCSVSAGVLLAPPGMADARGLPDAPVRSGAAAAPIAIRHGWQAEVWLYARYVVKYPRGFGGIVYSMLTHRSGLIPFFTRYGIDTIAERGPRGLMVLAGCVRYGFGRLFTGALRLDANRLKRAAAELGRVVVPYRVIQDRGAFCIVQERIDQSLGEMIRAAVADPAVGVAASAERIAGMILQTLLLHEELRAAGMWSLDFTFLDNYAVRDDGTLLLRDTGMIEMRFPDGVPPDRLREWARFWILHDVWVVARRDRPLYRELSAHVDRLLAERFQTGGGALQGASPAGSRSAAGRSP